MTISYGYIFIGLVLGLLGAAVVTRWGDKLRLMDKPEARSSHRVPTPKGGGIGILLTFGLVAGLEQYPLWFWLPPCIIACVSVLNDIREIAPPIRLGLHLLCSFWFVMGAHPGLLETPYSLLMLIFLVLFLVATANFYNFMDGIDGIASLTALAGFGLLLYLSLFRVELSPLRVLLWALAGAVAGFLPLNIPRARVFMGDVGSMLLGFLFGGITVYATRSLTDFFLLSAVLYPFYIDELTTMIIRVSGGENLLKAHRRHFYQILANQAGFPHWRIAIAYAIAQISIGTTCFILSTRLVHVVSFLTITTGLFVLIGGIIRHRIE